MKLYRLRIWWSYSNMQEDICVDFNKTLQEAKKYESSKVKPLQIQIMSLIRNEQGWFYEDNCEYNWVYKEQVKLKEYRNSNVFKTADIVKYYDEDGNELEVPSTEVKRRQFYNKVVINHGTKIKNGLSILEIYLK